MNTETSNPIVNAGDNDFQQQVLESDRPVIVDFWAPWCAPCRMQGPILERFAENNPGVKIVKVNVDESPTVAGTYGIRSIPTVAVFEAGKPVLGAVGVQDEHALGHLITEARNHKGEEAQA